MLIWFQLSGGEGEWKALGKNRKLKQYPINSNKYGNFKCSITYVVSVYSESGVRYVCIDCVFQNPMNVFNYFVDKYVYQSVKLVEKRINIAPLRRLQRDNVFDE